MRYLKVCGLATLVSLTFSTFAHAWIHAAWSAQGLMDAATLVVIAKPIKEQVIGTHPYEADPKDHPPCVRAADCYPDLQDPPVAYVDDVVSTFEVQAVVKGAVQGRLVVLHYQRFTKPLMMAGPGAINFESGSGKRYLMFLQQESDGRTGAVSGLLNYADAIAAIK